MTVSQFYSVSNPDTPIIATLLDCSKAFDKCLFHKIFTKLLEKGLPPIIVRVLIYVYEEQVGFEKLAGVYSTGFKLTNGTRQGSVLSPIIFSVYLDGLIQELRQQGLGCHCSGVWMGCLGYADDLILLAPSRETMAKMLDVCEKYALKHNLEFTTDPVPTKSKSKCLYNVLGNISLEHP